MKVELQSWPPTRGATRRLLVRVESAAWIGLDGVARLTEQVVRVLDAMVRGVTDRWNDPAMSEH